MRGVDGVCGRVLSSSTLDEGGGAGGAGVVQPSPRKYIFSSYSIAS